MRLSTHTRHPSLFHIGIRSAGEMSSHVAEFSVAVSDDVGRAAITLNFTEISEYLYVRLVQYMGRLCMRTQ